MTQEIIRLWAGIGLACLFSFSFVWVLLRDAQKGRLQPRNLAVLALAIMVSVTLVGDALFVCLIQSVIVSTGCLWVLHRYSSQGDSDFRVVAVLAITMLSSLVLSQASGTWPLGLSNWLSRTEAPPPKLLVEAATDSAMVSVQEEIDGRLDKVAADLRAIHLRANSVQKQWDSIEQAAERLFSNVEGRAREIRVVPVAPPLPTRVNGGREITVTNGRRTKFLLDRYEATLQVERYILASTRSYLTILDKHTGDHVLRRHLEVGESAEISLDRSGMSQRIIIDVIERSASQYRLRVYPLER